MNNSELKKLIDRIEEFREKRDWKQFHNPKDLAISLSLEAAEVLEHFQWKTKEEIEKYIQDNKEDLAEELADVFYWTLLMSHDLDIDIIESLHKKIDKNGKKYPVDKAKGTAKKYTEL